MGTAGFVPAWSQEALRFSVPIACTPSETCFVQNYVDADPGPGARDFRCGEATYDGHKGVDFRVLSMAAAKAGVPVLAAADGTVKALRDGVEDVLLRERDRGHLAGRACGNGVVLDHGGGWETQVCHLRAGSVRVAKGQRVARGSPLGAVGTSGFADFAHVHFEVRHNGVTLDPYTGKMPDGTCAPAAAATGDTGLWDAPAARAFPYRSGDIIDVGFAAAEPSTAQLEHGADTVPPARADGPKLLFYARLINARAGDRVRLAVRGPAGFTLDTTSGPLEHKKAVLVMHAGKRRTGGPWAAGRYEGHAALQRSGAVVSERRGVVEIR